MEISCPDCNQRLRVPDHLQDPLVRCRNCGRTFRTSEAVRTAFAAPAPAPQPQVEPEQPPSVAGPGDEQLNEFLTQTRSEPTIADQTRGRQKAAGWGVGVVVALMVLKGGVRLVKNLVHEDRKPAPAPVQIDRPQQEAIRKLLEQANERRRPPGALPNQRQENLLPAEQDNSPPK